MASQTPGSPDYAIGIGTSFAAPQVAGVASLMLARNANLTPGQVLGIISAAARPFADPTVCAQGPACGVGLLDAGLALNATVSSSQMAPPGTVPVIEYYRADRDHYFMTGDPADIAIVDTVFSNTFQRTGQVFYAWPNAALAPPNAVPVCRFYAPSPLIDSHFYTPFASECQYVITHDAGTWVLENPRGVLRAAAGRGRQLPGGHGAGLSLLRQSQRRQPSLQHRPDGAPRDDQPLMGAGRRTDRTQSSSARRSDVGGSERR